MISPYGKHDPSFLPIKERYLLNRPGSKKRTYHVVLDLSETELDYVAGDCVGIYPCNPQEKVEKIIRSVGASGGEQVADLRVGDSCLFEGFLRRRANLSQVSRKCLQKVESPLLEDRVAMKEYMEHHDLLEFLQEHGSAFSPQDLCESIYPLFPRYYSIASSMCEVGREVHLTVAFLKYDCKGKPRTGICSHFLCDQVKEGWPEVPLFIHPHRGFTLPKDTDTPIIMIGPGTGIAPYRSFMQNRVNTNAKGKNWLFFGEWNAAYDFYYEEEWKKWENEGLLNVDLAFSRDQDHKIYVQHRMWEQSKELYSWIEEGAVIFVCGDAKRMAKDVEVTLQKIIETHRGCDEVEAREAIKQMRKEGRYLRDVY